MIRVAGLHTLLEQGEDGPGPDGLTAREQLDRIGSTVRRLVRSASAVLSGELLPALEKAGIRLHRRGTLGPEARAKAADYFQSTVFPVLTPLAVDPGHPFPFISNLSLSLAVEAEDPVTNERRFARVKVPEILPRFVPLGGDDFIPLEDLIESHLDALFPGMRIVGVYPFRITPDMDMAILEAEADDLLQVVDRQVRRRRFGHVVRLEVDSQAPERMRGLLLDKLQLDRDDIYECCSPLGASALMALAGLQRPDLHDPPFVPAVARELVEGDVFAAIRAGDVLLHHPYDSFAPVLAFLRQAAADPDVLAIKMTLYRTGASSEVVKSLTTAAENGKQVALAIERRARPRGQAGAHLRQDERAGGRRGHRGALRGLAGGSADRPPSSRNLLPAAGLEGAVGEHPGFLCRRPVSRARPRLLLRARRRRAGVPLLRGLDAAQPPSQGGADVPGAAPRASAAAAARGDGAGSVRQLPRARPGCRGQLPAQDSSARRARARCAARGFRGGAAAGGPQRSPQPRAPPILKLVGFRPQTASSGARRRRKDR